MVKLVPSLIVKGLELLKSQQTPPTPPRPRPPPQQKSEKKKNRERTHGKRKKEIKLKEGGLEKTPQV